MARVAAELLPCFEGGGQVHLRGDLGAGKTTLVRSLLREMGFAGRVKSPSYGLIESYALPGRQVHHLDLYRLSHGEELAFLGIEELFDGDALILIEWPEKAQGFLPQPDWIVQLSDAPSGGRAIRFWKP